MIFFAFDDSKLARRSTRYSSLTGSLPIMLFISSQNLQYSFLYYKKQYHEKHCRKSYLNKKEELVDIHKCMYISFRCTFCFSLVFKRSKICKLRIIKLQIGINFSHILVRNNGHNNLLNDSSTLKPSYIKYKYQIQLEFVIIYAFTFFVSFFAKSSFKCSNTLL